MLFRANVSFSGIVSMSAGEVRELTPPVSDDLLKAGYIMPFEKKKDEKPKTKKGGKKA